jgi:hypothetical protein
MESTESIEKILDEEEMQYESFDLPEDGIVIEGLRTPN